MKAVFIFVVIFVVVINGAMAKDPPRPQLSEEFSADISVTMSLFGLSANGKGLWLADQKSGKQLEVMNFNGPLAYLNTHRLARYDLHRTYEIFANNSCEATVVSGAMPHIWNWTQFAVYEGRQKINGRDYDTWGFKMGYGEVVLAVETNDHKKPVYFVTESPLINITIRFETWSTSKPSGSHFDVPKQCTHKLKENAAPVTTGAPGCVSRGTMIARAQVWVDNKVPYNQGGRYQGYREDCSGYVSMVWETAQPGYVTSTLPQVSHPISKAELQPGDVLLCTTEHVVLFGGWADASQSHYVSFEETRPGEGTVKRVTPYPYWYNTGCFKPYRYNAVC